MVASPKMIYVLKVCSSGRFPLTTRLWLLCATLLFHTVVSSCFANLLVCFSNVSFSFWNASLTKNRIFAITITVWHTAGVQNVFSKEMMAMVGGRRVTVKFVTSWWNEHEQEMRESGFPAVHVCFCQIFAITINTRNKSTYEKTHLFGFADLEGS